MKRNYLLICCLLCCGMSILSAGTVLSLQQARAQALQNNSQVKAADETYQAAKDLQKASFTKFLPAFSAIGDYTYMNKKLKYEKDLGLDKILAGMAQANPGVVSDPFYKTLAGLVQQGMLPNKLSLELGQHDNNVFSLSAVQPLFTGGKIINQYKLAKLNTNLAESGNKLKQEEIVMKADEAYWRVVSLQEKVRLTSLYKTMVQSHLTDLQNLAEEGMVTQSDVLKAQVSLNEADLNLLKATDGLALARMALNQIVGFPLDEQTVLSDSLSVVMDSTFTNPDMDSIYQHRKEIAALTTGVQMSRTVEKLSRSRYLPNIALNAGYYGMRPNPYNSFENEIGTDWQVSLMAELQLWDWNARGNETSAARHNTKANEYKLQEAREMIELEVQQTRFQYDEAQAKVRMTTTHLAQAEENLRLTNDKFSEDMASSSDVLDAQTLWQKAGSELLDARTEARWQETRLKHACGLLIVEE